MTYIRIPVPRLTAGLMSNALGLLGLVLMVVGIGGLAGIWWAVMAAGVTGVALSYLISAQQPLPEIEVDETGVTTRFSSTVK
jgi:hypothetical protein